MSLLVKYIPNILSEEGREIKRIPYSRTVGECLTSSGFDCTGCKIIVSGKCVKDNSQKIKFGEEIIITPDVEGPLMPLIAWVVDAVVAFAVAHPFITAGLVLSTAYSVYSILQRPQIPSFGGSGGGMDEGSPTYNWNGMSTTQDVGVPKPVIYGEHAVPGNVINEYISTDGDKNYLNVLLSLCEGEIDSINDIRVNDQPVANFPGILTYERFGTTDQSIIPSFGELHNVYSVGVNLIQSSPHIYTTINSDVEVFEIKFTLPAGLYIVADTGATQSWFVTYQVEYKLTTDGSWTDLGTTTIDAKSRTSLTRIFRKEGLASGKYDIRVTRTSADSASAQQVGSLTFSSVDEIQTEALRYPYLALLGIRALATNQLQGSIPSFRATVKGRLVSIPEIKNGANVVDWDDYYWNPTASEYRLISDETPLTWDGTSYIDAYSANPIWCIKDLQTNTRYGLGDFIDLSTLDADILLEESRHCEEKVLDGSGGYEKRYRLDVVLDTQTKAIDLLSQMASTFRGGVFFGQSSVNIKIDKQNTGLPSQIFTMGNIVKNHYQLAYGSRREVYNVINAQFVDKDKDYKFNSCIVEDGASLIAGDGRNEKNIRMHTTRMSYALREARYALKVSRNISKTVTLRASTDAIIIQPYDKIAVSHDLPQIGFSGRVKSGTPNTITLDRDVTIEIAKSYTITVQHEDDTVETLTIANSPETTDVLTISGTFATTPQNYDKYIFGEINVSYKEYRVLNISRFNKLECNINAIEYKDEVYDDTTVTIPEDNYSALSVELQDVLNLSTSEMIVKLNDGTLLNTIEVWFNKPDQLDFRLNVYDKADIYLSDNDGDSWALRGSTKGDSFVIYDNIETGTTYKIAVVSVNTDGTANDVDSSPQSSITILGKQAPPSDVENYDISQQGDQLHFSWDAIPDGDLARYEIRKGADWNTATLIAEKVDITEFDFPIGSVGNETYLIRAVDTSGNLSLNTSSDTINVTPPPEMNFSVLFDPWSKSREYKLIDVSRIQTNLYDSDYARDSFQLDTSETWQDKEDEAKSWEQMITDGEFVEGQTVSSGSIEQQESDPLDLGTQFEFNIVVDADTKNVSGGTLTVQIKTSEDGTTWTVFANVNASTNYRARYVCFKYLLATSDTDHNINFYGATIFVNAANVKVDFGRDLLIAVGGTTILFRDDFTAEPRITGLNVSNGILGLIQVTSKSQTQMVIKVYDPVAEAYIGTAEIDWEVKGS